MFGFLALGFFASIAFGFADKIAAGGFLATIGGGLTKLFGGETDEEKKQKESDIKELKGLLKKKPDDLTPKERKRLQELSGRGDLDLTNELSDKEWEALEKATGSTKEEVEETEKENKKKLDETKKNKLLAVSQTQLEGKENDNSPEAVQARKDYDALLSCVYNDEGEELSLEEIEKNLDKLPDDMKGRLEKQVKAVTNDPEALKDFQTQLDGISDEQAAAAVENAKAQRLEITKQKKIDELDEKMKKELEGVTGDKAQEIKDRYAEEKKGIQDQYDAKIKEHKDKAAEINTAAKNKQAAEIANKTKQDLENQKKELEDDKDNKKLAEKYQKFEFKDGIDPGDLDGDDEEKSKAAKKQLEEAGLNPEVYKKVQNKKTDKKDNDGNPVPPTIEDILADEEIAKAIDDDKKKQLSEIDKKIAEQDKIINDQNTNKGAADPGKQDPPKEPAKNEPKETEKTEDEIKAEIKDKYKDKEGDDIPENLRGEDGKLDPKKVDDLSGDDLKSAADKAGIKTTKKEGEPKDPPKKEPDPKDPPKKDPDPKDEDIKPDDFEDGFSIKDKDGTEYYKKDGKFYMKDKDGEEVEMKEGDFGDWLKKVEDNTDFDPSDLEGLEDEDTNNKKQDPRKVWKQKTYKRGDKTFKTKSYYNKKGASISKEEFQEKVEKFQSENESIQDFLRDRLVIERFYPADISESKQLGELNLVEYLKTQMETED